MEEGTGIGNAPNYRVMKMDFNEFWQYAHWPFVFMCVGLIVLFERSLIKLAKRYLPRGSKIRKAVLWSRDNEPD